MHFQHITVDWILARKKLRICVACTVRMIWIVKMLFGFSNWPIDQDMHVLGKCTITACGVCTAEGAADAPRRLFRGTKSPDLHAPRAPDLHALFFAQKSRCKSDPRGARKSGRICIARRSRFAWPSSHPLPPELLLGAMHCHCLAGLEICLWDLQIILR